MAIVLGKAAWPGFLATTGGRLGPVAHAPRCEAAVGPCPPVCPNLALWGARPYPGACDMQ
eukprot:1283954-Lingulodinium_polyedra.AAC.1